MEPLSVSPAEAGQKLANFVARRVDAGQGEIQRWIRSGQVRINKRRAGPFDRVAAGDVIRVPPFARLRPLREPGESSLRACESFSDRRMVPYADAVYEDGDLVVVAKSPGLPTQEGTGHSDSLASRLAAHYAGAAFVPAPAHRLDRDSSGLIAAGKTYAAQRALSEAFAAREEAGAALVKDYLVWAWGVWDGAGVADLQDCLIKDDARRKVRVIAADREGSRPGRQARSRALGLRFLRLDRGDTASLILVRLLTGRTHQIRAQLAERGHPLLGDGTYGDRRRDTIHAVPGLMLHACRLLLPAPFFREFTLLPPWEEPWRVGALPDFAQLDGTDGAEGTDGV